MTPQIIFGVGFVLVGYGLAAFGLNLILGWGW
jgi:ABC-type uncharacterized transport system permease subunit